jgi:outer membrane protein
MKNKISTNNTNWGLWSISILALIFSVFSLAHEFLNRQDDVVSVDAVKLMFKYRGIEDAKKALLSRNREWQGNLDTLKKELQAAVADYGKNKATASKREIKLMEEVVQSRQHNLANYQQAMEDQMKKQNEELAGKILTKVNDYVKRYGKRKGYTIILAATQLGNVAYANESVDITDQVLVGLNEEYNKLK